MSITSAESHVLAGLLKEKLERLEPEEFITCPDCGAQCWLDRADDTDAMLRATRNELRATLPRLLRDYMSRNGARLQGRMDPEEVTELVLGLLGE